MWTAQSEKIIKQKNEKKRVNFFLSKEYDRNYVLDLMSESFKKLGDRFILFNEKANSEITNVIYSLKGHHSNYVPEKLVVI